MNYAAFRESANFLSGGHNIFSRWSVLDRVPSKQQGGTVMKACLGVLGMVVAVLVSPARAGAQEGPEDLERQFKERRAELERRFEGQMRELKQWFEQNMQEHRRAQAEKEKEHRRHEEREEGERRRAEEQERKGEREHPEHARPHGAPGGEALEHLHHAMRELQGQMGKLAEQLQQLRNMTEELRKRTEGFPGLRGEGPFRFEFRREGGPGELPGEFRKWAERLQKEGCPGGCPQKLEKWSREFGERFRGKLPRGEEWQERFEGLRKRFENFQDRGKEDFRRRFRLDGDGWEGILELIQGRDGELPEELLDLLEGFQGLFNEEEEGEEGEDGVRIRVRKSAPSPEGSRTLRLRVEGDDRRVIVEPEY